MSDLQATMSVASMLPPVITPPTFNHRSPVINSPELTSAHCNDASSGLSKYEEHDPLTVNLNEDSMMVLSQSVDSLHTLATTGGTLDDSDHQVRTVFVSGLPLDAKPRELYLLFCGFTGYQSSTLKPAGKNGKVTAPVGFVTFDSREQADEAMSKLQGIKFDPDGSQHIRLEFARTNTKVTKPKFTNSTGVGFNALGMNAVQAAASLNQQHAAAAASCCASNLVSGGLQGLVAGLPPTLFNQLANTGAGTAAFESNPTLFTSTDPTGALHWNALNPSSPMGSAYENAAYLASAAGLLQANNFRTLLPGCLNSAGFNLAASNPQNLQMVQAAIAQANAAAALGSPIAAATTHVPQPLSPTQQHTISPISSVTCSPSSLQTAVTCPTAAATTSKGAPANSYTLAQPNAQINSFMVQLQQQHQQSLAAVQSSNNASNQTAQSTSIGYGQNPSTASQLANPQMTAAAIGLLGGYNSLVKELTGRETAHLQPALPTYSQQINY